MANNKPNSSAEARIAAAEEASAKAIEEAKTKTAEAEETLKRAQELEVEANAKMEAAGAAIESAKKSAGTTAEKPYRLPEGVTHFRNRLPFFDNDTGKYYPADSRIPIGMVRGRPAKNWVPMRGDEPLARPKSEHQPRTMSELQATKGQRPEGA